MFVVTCTSPLFRRCLGALTLKCDKLFCTTERYSYDIDIIIKTLFIFLAIPLSFKFTELRRS